MGVYQSKPADGRQYLGDQDVRGQKARYSLLGPQSELAKWKLHSQKGRQVWLYNEQPLYSIALKGQQSNPATLLNLNASTNDYISAYHTGLLECNSVESTNCDNNDILQTTLKTAVSGMEFFNKLQHDDGHFSGSYGGPLFLLPGFVFAAYITKITFTQVAITEMIRYLLNTQNIDGGWGIHSESPSTVFGSVLNYVAFRILVDMRDQEESHLVNAMNESLELALHWIKAVPGRGAACPQWGKLWLAVLGILDWSNLDALLPEMVLLPRWVPVHPNRIWCYARTVYTPMSYLYTTRFTAPSTPLLISLRNELNEQSPQLGPTVRYKTSSLDLYTPPSLFLRAAFTAMNGYERMVNSILGKTLGLISIRKRAISKLQELIDAEDRQTNYICIGPVNKAMHVIISYAVYGPESTEFQRHVSHTADYLWMGHDGLKVNGTNGSQVWDTSFYAQALIEAKHALAINNPNCSNTAHTSMSNTLMWAEQFLVDMQFDSNHEDITNTRGPTKGGWPFSTKEMGWTVADCTAEGIKVLLSIYNANSPTIFSNKIQFDQAISCNNNGTNDVPTQGILNAIELLLVMQNGTGGWATCETTRGHAWLLELFNASEVFGEIMVDYDYVECTSSAVQALALARTRFYAYFAGNTLTPLFNISNINKSIDRGIAYILREQRVDGSWEGQWGVCFTYATWFAIEALIDANIPKDHPAIQRAVSFLLSIQYTHPQTSSECHHECNITVCLDCRNDGGWGESFNSCVTRSYVAHQQAQVVNTAWAMLALLRIYPDLSTNPSISLSLTKAVQFLVRTQTKDGNWPTEAICGVFNKNCMIEYSNFKNIFPTWALFRYYTALTQ